MKKIYDIGGETMISLVLLVSIFFLLDPFRVFTGEMLRMCLTVLIVVFTGLLAGAVWRENVKDERESSHRMFASRLGFIAGIITLTIAATIQILQHTLDGWVIVALGVMVITKLAGLGISRRRW